MFICIMLQCITQYIMFVANYCNMETTSGRQTTNGLQRGQLFIQKVTSLLTSRGESAKEMSSNRRGVSVFFLMHGLCFATWASRIPTIQSSLNLSAAALGTILFALPLGF